MKKVYYSDIFGDYYNPNTRQHYKTRKEAEEASEQLRLEIQEERRKQKEVIRDRERAERALKRRQEREEQKQQLEQQKFEERMARQKDKHVLNRTVTCVVDDDTYNRLWDAARDNRMNISQFVRDCIIERLEAEDGTQTEEL